MGSGFRIETSRCWWSMANSISKTALPVFSRFFLVTEHTQVKEHRPHLVGFEQDFARRTVRNSSLRHAQTNALNAKR